MPKICDLREALEEWSKEIADLHTVYGIGRCPLEIFKSEEEKALRPLPQNRWEPAIWTRCEVRREWRIMLDCVYYSVPCHLIGETVEVCTTDSLVRILYNNREVALHERATKKWEYKRKPEHAPPFKEAVLQCSREGLLSLAQDIGPFTRQVAEAILSHPSVDKLKPVRHLLRLAEKYSNERLENACKRAFNCKLFAYISVKGILEKRLDFQPIEADGKSKVIPLTSYRFARDPKDYKSSSFNERPKTFEEKLAEQRPFSKHGNAMLGGVNAQLYDQILDEQQQSFPKELYND